MACQLRALWVFHKESEAFQLAAWDDKAEQTSSARCLAGSASHEPPLSHGGALPAHTGCCLREELILHGNPTHKESKLQRLQGSSCGSGFLFFLLRRGLL